MHLELVTLRGKKLDQAIYEVTIPTPNGPIAVFPSHEELVTIAVPGALAVRRDKDDGDDQLEYFAISGGVVEVSHDRVRILVDEAEQGDEIIEAESKAALERALHMRETAKNQVELEKAAELVDRHAVRLQVAGLRRRKSR
jgi:F-type H+-transporting ATPase subunit epsilon